MILGVGGGTEKYDRNKEIKGQFIIVCMYQLYDRLVNHPLELDDSKYQHQAISIPQPQCLSQQLEGQV